MGLHVRAATLLCKAAMKYQSTVTIAKGSAVADCKSCLDLLSLMSPQGTKLSLTVDGVDESEATKEIVHLFNMKFYEDEFASAESIATSKPKV